jgi:hypothetical protein
LSSRLPLPSVTVTVPENCFQSLPVLFKAMGVPAEYRSSL